MRDLIWFTASQGSFSGLGTIVHPAAGDANSTGCHPSQAYECLFWDDPGPPRRSGSGILRCTRHTSREIHRPGSIGISAPAIPAELYSNEFEQERVADVGIVLDARLRTNLMRERHSLFEYSVQAAASLADTFLAQGNRVGLLLYGHYLHWTFPGYGKIQRERILQALARAEPGDSLVFAGLEHIPVQFFPAKSQIVLVSPLGLGDYNMLLQLRARGYQVMVISPDPVAFEMAYLPKVPEVSLAGRIIHLERALLMQKLNHAGVQVLNWDVANPFDQVGPGVLGRPLAWLRATGR